MAKRTKHKSSTFTTTNAFLLLVVVLNMGFFSKSVFGLAASSKATTTTTTLPGTTTTTTTTATSSSCPTLDVEARLRGALWGFFAGDALAAPSHWYYGGRDQVIRDYDGPITDYVKPKLQLWGSILNKSNLNGGGRATTNSNNQRTTSSSKKPVTIVGDVINHGKQEYWDPNKSIHYHATLQRGENTLEASLARVLMKSIVQNHGQFNAHHFRQAYMDFMMTPNSHNDTYASTCHRMFFANLVFGKKPPEQCPDNDQHNVDTIDGLVLPTIAAMTLIRPPTTKEDNNNNNEDVNNSATAIAASACAAVTRKSSVLEHMSRQWGQLVQDCILAESEDQVTLAIQKCAKAMGVRRQLRTQGPDDMTACYLSQAVPALLDMVARYHMLMIMSDNNNNSNNDNHPFGVALQQALLSNANVGGENVHRGSILGAVLGARTGLPNIPPNLIHGLYHHDEIAQEIDDFVAAVLVSSSSSSSTEQS